MKNVLSAVVSFLAIFVILSGLILSPILAGAAVVTQKCSVGALEETYEVCGNSFFSTNGSTQFANYVTYSGTVDYVANGTAMRNFGYGTITISGVPNGFPKLYGANP